MDEFFRIANQKGKSKFVQEQLQLEMPPPIPIKQEIREARPERGSVVIDMYDEEEDC